MSKYALENYEYIKGLHKQIAELEARCGDLVAEEIITGILKDERIAELEAGLKYIAAQKDVIGWAPAAHTAQSVLAQQPAKEQGE